MDATGLIAATSTFASLPGTSKPARPSGGHETAENLCLTELKMQGLIQLLDEKQVHVSKPERLQKITAGF